MQASPVATVMVGINDHPDIRRAFEGGRLETMNIRYSTANQRKGPAAVTCELAIMYW